MSVQRQTKAAASKKLYGNTSYLENLRTFVFRIVRKHDGKLIKEHRLTALPQTFNLSLASRDSLQHTASGIFVDRWGRAAGRLTITGVFPNETILLKGGDKIDGAAQFKDLRDMLEDYTGARNKDSDEEIFIRVADSLVPWFRSDLELQLFIFAHTLAPSTNEEWSREWYRVHLPANYMSFNKSVGDRHTNFPYNINLVLLDRLDQVREEQKRDKADDAEVKDGILNKAGRATEWVDGIKDSTESAVNSAFGVASKIYASLNTFEDAFTGALIQLDKFAFDTDKFIRYPFRKIRGLADRARQLYHVYSNAINFPDAIQGEIKATLEYFEALLSRPDLFMEPLTDSGGRQYKSARSIKVEPGMTLQKLEVELGVPAEDIIKLNNLAYPYIDEFVNTDAILQFGRKTLRVGDDLLIPIAFGEEITATTPPDFEGKKKTPEEQFYGTAWVLDADGNMVGDSSKTKFLQVAGIDNVLQALRVRYLTERGSFPVHPLYGMERFIGTPASAAAIEMLRVDLHTQTLSDPRINAVEALSVEFRENGLVDAQVTARLKNTRESVLLNVDGLRVA